MKSCRHIAATSILTVALPLLSGCGKKELSETEQRAQDHFKREIAQGDDSSVPAAALDPAAPAASPAATEVVKEELKGEEIAVLTTAPNVPPPITRKHPTKMIVNLEVSEKVMRMADGVDYTFWTFGGTVPGKFIRVREGDYVEFHLANHPDSKMPHNIDLHAVSGPGGGATSSFTAPGHESVFSFTALNPGLYIYHCATAPVGMHIANGMYGLILVEPKSGLPPVDKELYVLQSDFYTKGAYGDAGLQPFSMDKALREEADYVVFNGSVGAMAGDNAATAKVGDTIRMFVGNGGPNLVSSFHVIGEIFDKVYTEGGSVYTENVQTTLVPAGGSTMVEFKIDVPGTYIIVDHSIFRAFNKGAIAMIKVEGDADELVYSGKIDDRIYHAEGGAIQEIPQESSKPAPAANLAERVERGKTIYTTICMACHQAEGQGIPRAFPPLAKSDYLNADADRAIDTVLKGMTGKVSVNGEEFNSIMPSLGLDDHKVANVLSYVYSQWDNNGTEVTPEMVKARRALGGKPVGGGEH